MWRFLPILVTVCLEVFQGSTCQASPYQTAPYQTSPNLALPRQAATSHAADARFSNTAHCLAEKPSRCAAEPFDGSDRAAIIAEGESPEDDDHLTRGAGDPNCQITALDVSSVVRLAAQTALLGPATPLRILLECWRN